MSESGGNKPRSFTFIGINAFLFSLFGHSAARRLQAEPAELGGGGRRDRYFGVSASTWAP